MPTSLGRAGLEGVPLGEGLRSALNESTRDRTSAPRDVVLEAAGVLHEWLTDRDEEFGSAVDARALEQGLADWIQAHGWRGACARFVDSIRRTWHWSHTQEDLDPRTALLEELGLWTWTTPELLGAPFWDGTPLGAGPRLAFEDEVQRATRDRLGRGHVVCVHGYSERVATALETAQRAGLEPEALVSEGGADGSGRRLARRLAKAGVRVSLCYDAALSDAAPRADRIWLGTEAIGANGFLGRVGTRRLLEEAARHEVPVELIAAGDDLVPGGQLELPAWCEDEPWLLWEYAPRGVQLETQLYERVSLDEVTVCLTEAGEETPTQFHLRALRTEVARRLDV